ncbi:hypothetical protein [Halobacteriovorax sp. JY17]|uniref:hypothetical protein n=1 Tax=Halobacteriovorax sp. JY17 TaxID=2014617 RepID=UPI000C50B7DC|nr:hypothetical protein [Halobacteriovorax sp. JY17]PIK14523.1 MAG: hypothetical protein CES88_09265 [Halobacteriovorax sp. JY17]
MTFVFSFGFILLFYKISIDATSGFYIHYANYMASRTYLTVENNSANIAGSDNFAFERAKAVFESYKPEVMIVGFNGVMSVNDPEATPNKLYVGTIVDYSIPFSFSELVGGRDPVFYKSESFLGREPTRAECLARVCKTMQEIGAECNTHITFFDNGC